jgi:SAM-dependent methyltransferase
MMRAIRRRSSWTKTGGGVAEGTGLWTTGRAYEPYIGRWSRRLAERFVPWLAAPAGARWLDVGCGTGALTSAVLAQADPAQVVGVDPSRGFLQWAAAHEHDPRASFLPGEAGAVPAGDGEFDVVVSGLVLNFVPDPAAALREIRRVTRPGGLIGVYVWDYGGGIQLIHRFWEAAIERDPDVARLDRAERFDLCHPDALRTLFEEGGLVGVEVDAIEIPTVFADFDDYWTPFLGGVGPAPSYLASLPETARVGLREALRERLPTEPDGSIHLTASAWTVRARVPG